MKTRPSPTDAPTDLARVSANDDRAGFAARLRMVMRQFQSVLALAQVIDVSDSAVHKWLAASAEPGRDKLVAIARASGVSLEWLVSGAGPMRPGEYIFVPRYAVPAALGSAAQIQSEQIVDCMAFRAEWIHRRLMINPVELALIEIADDAMEPTMQAGDLVLVDLSRRAIAADALYAIARGGDLIVRRVEARRAGMLAIVSDNRKYREGIISVEASRSLNVVGRAVWSGGVVRR